MFFPRLSQFPYQKEDSDLPSDEPIVLPVDEELSVLLSDDQSFSPSDGSFVLPFDELSVLVPSDEPLFSSFGRG